MADSEDSVGAIDRDFARLDDGACFEIDVTGHKLYVRREQGELIGVRHKPGQTIVEPHEKDGEFVRRMMGWKGYREVPRDEPPFDYQAEKAADDQEGDQQRIMTDGGRDQSGVAIPRGMAWAMAGMFVGLIAALALESGYTHFGAVATFLTLVAAIKSLYYVLSEGEPNAS